jgi:hypothetical protein
MKYMMIAMGNADYEAGKPPSPELMQAIGELAEKAVRAGKLVFQAGLQPTRAGWRMGLAKGKRYAVDGPFAETKEVIGGFAIFECASREEAMTFAQDFVDTHARCGIRDMGLEVRPLYGPGDMGCPSVDATTATAHA